MAASELFTETAWPIPAAKDRRHETPIRPFLVGIEKIGVREYLARLFFLDAMLARHMHSLSRSLDSVGGMKYAKTVD